MSSVLSKSLTARRSVLAYSSVNLGSRFSMSSILTKGLTEAVGSLLDSEKYSDLTITTKHRSFKVHKAIICSQSKGLAAMCDSSFKESSKSILELEHDDPATVERMITFFYTGTYDYGDVHVQKLGFESIACAMLVADVLLHSIADKYDIQGLKAWVKPRFESIAIWAWRFPDFATVVAKVFDPSPDTDTGLRDIVSLVCADHIDDFLASKIWGDVLSNNGAIGLAILKVGRQRSV